MKYLKFEASWCGACKMIQPQLNKVSAEGITVEKINAEDNNDMVVEYNIRNLPTVVLVDDSGKEFYRNTGSKIKAADLIQQYNDFTNV